MSASSSTTKARGAAPVLQDLENDSIGGSVSGTLDHYISYDQVLRLHSYFEYYDRNLGKLSEIETRVANFQIEYEHQPFEGHLVNWALEHCFIHENLEDSFTFDFDPLTSERHLLTLGFEDQIEISERSFFLIPAGKVELHNQTDNEYLGSLKAKWLPTERHTFWASVAGAARTPSLAEREMTANLPNVSPQSALFVVEGNKDLSSEKSISYEFGSRFLLSDELFVETNLFLHRAR